MSTVRWQRARALVPRRERRGRFRVVTVGQDRLEISAPPPGTFQSGVPAGGATVRLVAADGQPLQIAGVGVIARTLLGSGATLVTEPETAVTDAQGVATFSAMTLTGTAGTYAIEFLAVGRTATVLDMVVAFSGFGDLAVDVAVAVTPELFLQLWKSGTLIASRVLEPVVLGVGESPRYELVLTDLEKAALGGSTTGVECWLIADGGTQPIRVSRVRMFLR